MPAFSFRRPATQIRAAEHHSPPEQPTLNFTGSDTMALLQVMVRTKNSPESICRSITLVAVDGTAK